MLGKATFTAPSIDIKGCLGKFEIFSFIFSNKINVTEIRAHCTVVPSRQGEGWDCMLIHQWRW